MNVVEFLSKGQTLKNIRLELQQFCVPELLVFDVATLVEESDLVVKEIIETFDGRLLAIRSSAAGEDGSISACAGEYTSVLNVASDDEKSIHGAIQQVVTSYSRTDMHDFHDEFIVQEMLLDTSMSGVVFTHDLNTGAPYYVINYDDVSGLTDVVTSGEGKYANRTLYIHRGAIDSVRSKRFRILLQAILELEKNTNSQYLDIEFALGKDMTPYLLQVRAITTLKKHRNIVSDRIDSALVGIQGFVEARLQPVSGAFGRTTVLGQMPDWNPAEMIGRAPRALAFSLYKKLITDRAWSVARKKMKYSVPNGHPLMVSLAGQPFIDTRLSFHSFLPEGLPADISEKLVNVWVEKLKKHPELHDKIEFDVAITAYSFDIDDKLGELEESGLTPAELSLFKKLVHQQTRQLLSDEGESGVTSALAQIRKLQKCHTSNRAQEQNQNVLTLYEMVDDCINYGTIPFSILARHGFIAQTLLQSLKTSGILTSTEVSSIKSGIRTVASDLVEDMHRVQSGILSRGLFMDKYGHLRPGTYDILSLRYDQMFDFTEDDPQINQAEATTTFILDSDKKQRINRLLEENGFGDFNSKDLLDYIQAATAGREYGKFIFTRSISNILELIASYGESHSLTREEMSYISIDELFGVISRSSEGSVESNLRRISTVEAEAHLLTVAIRLPQILFDVAGVQVIPFQVSHPNFITQNKIIAQCVHIQSGKTSVSLSGKIVLIENADPGFDWIFSKNIGALITKYGGANSHMAIRCAEFEIPAAIGCGEQRFDALKKSKQILLDCSAGLINSLH